MEKLWKEHLRSGDWRFRLGRILTLALLWWVFALLITSYAHPFVPFRGEKSRMVDEFIMFLSGITLLVLMFFVLDTALRSRRFAKKFSEEAAQWPPDLLARYSPGGKAIAPGVEEWLAVQFLAKGTAKIDQFIYYPFFVLLVMIAARFIGGFSWSIPLLLVFCFNALLVFSVSLSLHLTAEKARGAAVDRLEPKLIAAQCLHRTEDKETIQMMMDKINEIEVGAFAPLSRQPFVRAVLLPVGGAVLALVQSGS
jgi:hypothetical protein